MDLCAIDVTHIPDCAVGDEVVLLGRQGKEYISANEISAKAKTISYEVLCALGKRAPRVFHSKRKKRCCEPRLRRYLSPMKKNPFPASIILSAICLQTRARDEELGNAIYYEMFETLSARMIAASNYVPVLNTISNSTIAENKRKCRTFQRLFSCQHTHRI